MIGLQESQDLMKKFIELKNNYEINNTSQNKILLDNHRAVCIDKFEYMVEKRISRYKSFSNYDDLYQDGVESLIRAMNTYDINKGCFFWWAHHYIDTKIFRQANFHSTIKYPLKLAKENMPYKTSFFPVIIDEKLNNEDYILQNQYENIISNRIEKLSDIQKNIVSLYFGINDKEGSHSINKICIKLRIGRQIAIDHLNNAINEMKDLQL